MITARAENQEVQTEQNEKYFIYGKNRIIISEHFPPTGKSISDCIVEMVKREIEQKKQNN